MAADDAKLDGNSRATLLVVDSASGEVRQVKGTAAGAMLVDLAAGVALAINLDAANDEVAVYGWDGAAVERIGNNLEATVLASAARVATTASVDQVNTNHRGMAILLDVSAVAAPAGQIDSVQIQVKLANGYRTVYSWDGLAIAATGQYAFCAYPGAASAAGWNAPPFQGPVPRNWRANVVHGNANSITYSLAASYIV